MFQFNGSHYTDSKHEGLAPTDVQDTRKTTESEHRIWREHSSKTGKIEVTLKGKVKKKTE